MNEQLDSVLHAETPEGIAFTVYPAGLLSRTCAFAIDCCIQGVVLLAVFVAVEISGRTIGLWVALITMFALEWLYHVVWEQLCKGQSPGKRAMGLRVVERDGSPVQPSASFLRNLLRFADTFLYLYAIALVCMMCSRGFRRIGDWAAGTLVVYTSGVPSYSPQFAWLTQFAAVAPPRTLTYEEKQAVLAFARRYPMLGKKRADEIAAAYAAALQNPFNMSYDDDDATDQALPAAAYLLGIARTLHGEARGA